VISGFGRNNDQCRIFPVNVIANPLLLESKTAAINWSRVIVQSKRKLMKGILSIFLSQVDKTVNISIPGLLKAADIGAFPGRQAV